MRVVVLLALVVGCAQAPTPITIVPSPSTEAALRDFAMFVPYRGITIGAVGGGGFTIRVIDDEVCRECYRIEAAGENAWNVRASDVLGAQYGVAHALENLGIRFRSPVDTFVPEQLVFEGGASLDVLHEPAVKGQRGLQLHTLHPIEAHFAVWTHPDEPMAWRIFDWIVKNRGNHVQWPALDDIMDPARHATWSAKTARILEVAHRRGLTVGLGVQLFGSGNMQQAFDLSDSETLPFEDELAVRLPLVTALPFDAYVLAFGEFFGEDAERFIAAVNATTAAIRAARPRASVHASIHVGADQRVTYRGEELPYYFLVKHADPSIVSNVHTVMFYNLFEDAGGAYGHGDFVEHREYLFEQMRAGRPASYYPESAYWVAFDNSVPLFLPLYVRSRWLDLHLIAERARVENLPGLDGHLIFSSGWEWGYWLNDYAALRASYALPDSPAALIAHAYGQDLAKAAPLVDELAELQAMRSIDGRLSPYLAGRDALIDLGDQLGIHSQPDRVTFDDLARDATLRDPFATDVLAPLGEYAAELSALSARVAKLVPDSRWGREVADGFAVTAARARFVHAAYAAVLAHLASSAVDRAAIDAALADGKRAVARRHGDLHYMRPKEELIGRPANATVYAYGYLHQADTLCYWEREKAQLAAIIDGATAPIPHCWL
jgi:hypothetical protein